MKTAEQMRKITLKHRFNNERINGLIFALNHEIKREAKDGRYSVRHLTSIYNKDEAEYVKQYYEKLNYKVEFDFAWGEIYINWEKENDCVKMD